MKVNTYMYLRSKCKYSYKYSALKLGPIFSVIFSPNI